MGGGPVQGQRLHRNKIGKPIYIRKAVGENHPPDAMTEQHLPDPPQLPPETAFADVLRQTEVCPEQGKPRDDLRFRPDFPRRGEQNDLAQHISHLLIDIWRGNVKDTAGFH